MNSRLNLWKPRTDLASLCRPECASPPTAHRRGFSPAAGRALSSATGEGADVLANAEEAQIRRERPACSGADNGERGTCYKEHDQHGRSSGNGAAILAASNSIRGPVFPCSPLTMTDLWNGAVKSSKVGSRRLAKRDLVSLCRRRAILSLRSSCVSRIRSRCAPPTHRFSVILNIGRKYSFLSLVRSQLEKNLPEYSSRTRQQRVAGPDVDCGQLAYAIPKSFAKSTGL